MSFYESENHSNYINNISFFTIKNPVYTNFK